MPIRVGILSTAHMHVWGYVHGLKSNPAFELVGIWDDDLQRRSEFSLKTGIPTFDRIEDLLESVDAVVITSENVKHAELGMIAAKHKKHILCEKPLVTSIEGGEKLLTAADEAAIVLMTAFPCPYSPAFERLQQRLAAGEIGDIVAICSTNRGRCPFGWFVEKSKSGGGAMIDHTVHVSDLLWRLIGEEPSHVQAQIGNNMYGQDWEDTAMLTLHYSGGVFATLDSSWSRPKCYKTWGDVTMNVVGTKGVLELNMFNQEFDLYQEKGHSVVGYGSDLDSAIVAEFGNVINDGSEPKTTGADGLRASRIALAAYESVRSLGPVSLAS